MDKNDLLRMINHSRSELSVLAESIDPGAEITPGWAIQELVGHLTAWEQVINRALIACQQGDPPYFMEEQDFDLFNQEAVEYRSGWDLDQVLQEWSDVRSALIKTIQEFKDADLELELVTPWGSERTVAELIEIVSEHEMEHLEEVKKAGG